MALSLSPHIHMHMHAMYSFSRGWYASLYSLMDQMIQEWRNSTGRDCSIATAKIDSVPKKYHVQRSNCMGFGVDNASVSVGICHSIMTHVKKQNNAYSFKGVLMSSCLQHSWACFKGIPWIMWVWRGRSLCRWLDKSTKRKVSLKECCHLW